MDNKQQVTITNPSVSCADGCLGCANLVGGVVILIMLLALLKGCS